ncbi:hypothetical protein E2C01_060824 [Portunus trituberculatus]|uniref:Uncharacterized protein n=1 Tax=Portunus trituberculatus TaxID=210409 RepID=A0A5B7H961_PORTR|nr:hypothetical protein [Portunus trituberculatus]
MGHLSNLLRQEVGWRRAGPGGRNLRGQAQAADPSCSPKPAVLRANKGSIAAVTLAPDTPYHSNLRQVNRTTEVWVCGLPASGSLNSLRLLYITEFRHDFYPFSTRTHFYLEFCVI